MSRKVFLSILGTGFYTECTYHQNEKKTSSKTRFVQQASLEIIGAEKWNENDLCCIFLTDKAEKDNWTPTSRYNSRTKQTEDYKGLQHVLKEMNLPISIIAPKIPNGDTESEIWEIFSTIYQKLEDGDELYVDLTHSFRFMPMLLLVLTNYAKFLKNISVAHIAYGNFEARQADIAPYTDLSPIVDLQNWTIATADLLENGQASKISEMTTKTINPIVKERVDARIVGNRIKRFSKDIQELTDSLRTNRGKYIQATDTFKNIKTNIEEIKENLIPPLTPILEKLVDKLGIFNTTNDSENGYAAARWCYEHGLYQQAITILQESIISYFGKKYKKDISNEKNRNPISQALHIISQEGEKNYDKVAPENHELVRHMVENDDEMKNISTAYRQLTQLRNDINHCGYRQNPQSAKNIKEEIYSFLEKEAIQSLFSKFKPPMLINLSNHLYELWSKDQQEAASEFGRYRDLPFPAIDPTASETEVQALAEAYLAKILPYTAHETVTVHLMGEMTFVYALVQLLHRHGIRVIASTSKRESIELGDGRKESTFTFVRFRSYLAL